MLANRSSTNRSAVTNGSHLLAGIDGRSAPARRYRDLVHDLSAQLGGPDKLSATELGLVRQAAALSLRAEQLQAAIIRGEPVDGDQLIRLSSEVRRILSAIRKRDGAAPAQPRQTLRDYLAATVPAIPSSGGGS